MATFVIAFSDGSSCEIIADEVAWENGCIVFSRHLDLPAKGYEPEAVFSARSGWTYVTQTDTHIAWNNQPAPAAEKPFTIPFATSGGYERRTNQPPPPLM
jgi:hypothetical protein